MVSSRDLAITLGDQLAPSFISLTQDLLPLIQGTKHWVATHPQFVSGAFKLISALLAIKIATVGAQTGAESPYFPLCERLENCCFTSDQLASTDYRTRRRWQITLACHWIQPTDQRRTETQQSSGGQPRSRFYERCTCRSLDWASADDESHRSRYHRCRGSSLPYLPQLGAVSGWFKQRWADIQEAFNGGIAGTGKLLINWSPAGLLYKAFAAALKYFGVTLPAKFTDFGGHLIDGLINGIKNKWGSLKSSVTGMGDSISSWFKQCWADIQEAFNGGIAGTGKLLINWSPAGLLYKAFAAALKYLGVDLPAKFTDFGGHLVDGLINGIKNKWESLKSSVTGMGDSISGWFSEKLGIHSPSRVFMGFGDNIAQGPPLACSGPLRLQLWPGSEWPVNCSPECP